MSADFLSVFPTEFFRVGFFLASLAQLSLIYIFSFYFVDIVTICFNKVALWRYTQAIIQYSP